LFLSRKQRVSKLKDFNHCVYHTAKFKKNSYRFKVPFFASSITGYILNSGRNTMVLDTARLMAQSNGGISLQKSHSLKNILECMNQGPRKKNVDGTNKRQNISRECPFR
jgi:hypothetical protein